MTKKERPKKIRDKITLYKQMELYHKIMITLNKYAGKHKNKTWTEIDRELTLFVETENWEHGRQVYSLLISECRRIKRTLNLVYWKAENNKKDYNRNEYNRICWLYHTSIN